MKKVVRINVIQGLGSTLKINLPNVSKLVSYCNNLLFYTSQRVYNNLVLVDNGEQQSY